MRWASSQAILGLQPGALGRQFVGAHNPRGFNASRSCTLGSYFQRHKTSRATAGEPKLFRFGHQLLRAEVMRRQCSELRGNVHVHFRIVVLQLPNYL